MGYRSLGEPTLSLPLQSLTRAAHIGVRKGLGKTESLRLMSQSKAETLVVAKASCLEAEGRISSMQEGSGFPVTGWQQIVISYWVKGGKHGHTLVRLCPLHVEGTVLSCEIKSCILFLALWCDLVHIMQFLCVFAPVGQLYPAAY